MRITVLQNIHKKNLHTFTISWFSSYCIHTSDSTSSCRAYTLHNVYDSQSCDLCGGNRLKIILNIYIELDHLLFSLRVGVSGGVICFSSLPLRMDSMSCSRGVGVDFRGGPNWRSEAWRKKSFRSVERRDRESVKPRPHTFFNGGRDLMNSKIIAWASFLTRGGISPFTITLRNWYFLFVV